MTLTADSIAARFGHSVAQFTTHTAISAPAGQWTYAELDRRANVIAAEILNHLGADSEPVALLFDHDAPLIAAILGTLKANKMYLALDPNHPPEQIRAMLTASGARLLLADAVNESVAKAMAAGPLQILVVTEKSAQPTAVQLPAISGEAPAWLMFTSGSTSQPKGVWQNHRGIVHEAEVYAELAAMTPADRVSLLTACGLAAAGATLYGALLHGATVCMFSVRTQGVERLAHWLVQEHITIFHSVPTVFRHLMRAAEAKNSLAYARLVRLGGEPVLRGDVETFQRLCPDACRLMQSLSSTETGIITTLVFEKLTPLPEGRVPAGRPVRGVEVFLLDEKDQPLKNGGEGRIAIRSARLRQGYWQQSVLTAEKFQRQGNSSVRTFISNDLGRFLPDGTLEHLGRADQLVKIRGLRVDLGEVEAALMTTKLAREAVAVAIEDASGEKRLAAYFVPRPGAEISAQNFRRCLRGQIPAHMIPNDFLPLEKLPLTAAGKIDRRALPALARAENKAALDRSQRPLDLVENRIARIWQTVLNCSPIARTDDFFDLGGTSLQSVEVLSQIEKNWGVALPPSTLTEQNTVEKLALLLRDHIVIPSPRPLVTLREGGPGRPLFLIHSGQGDVTSYGLLTRRLPGRPIYGLQSPGLQGESWPLMSISAMAGCYLREITAKDPTGPYFLGATCMGGMVAFEIAQRLLHQGKKIAFMAFMDVPYPLPYSEHPNPVERHYGPWRDFGRDFGRIVRWALIRGAGFGRSPRGLAKYRRFVAHMNTRALRRYRPGIYPGEIFFYNSSDSGFARDRRLRLHRHARTAHAISIPGSRAALFVTPGVDEMAKHLQAALIAAEDRCRSSAEPAALEHR